MARGRLCSSRAASATGRPLRLANLVDDLVVHARSEVGLEGSWVLRLERCEPGQRPKHDILHEVLSIGEAPRPLWKPAAGPPRERRQHALDEPLTSVAVAGPQLGQRDSTVVSGNVGGDGPPSAPDRFVPSAPQRDRGAWSRFDTRALLVERVTGRPRTAGAADPRVTTCAWMRGDVRPTPTAQSSRRCHSWSGAARHNG